MTVNARKETDPVTDSRLVIVDSRTFLCACLHPPNPTPPPPFLLFSQSCVSTQANRQGSRGEDGGGGGGGGGLWEEDLGEGTWGVEWPQKSWHDSWDWAARCDKGHTEKSPTKHWHHIGNPCGHSVSLLAVSSSTLNVFCYSSTYAPIFLQW